MTDLRINLACGQECSDNEDKNDCPSHGILRLIQQDCN